MKTPQQGTLLVFLLVTASRACLGQEVPEITVGSGPLRSFAEKSPLPEYPSRLAAAGKEGKVVVQVVLEPDGAISDVEVVEFSDPAMGASVQAALKEWTFRPIVNLENGKACRATGKLTFHFRRENGKPVVIDQAALSNSAVRAKADAQAKKEQKSSPASPTKPQ